MPYLNALKWEKKGPINVVTRQAKASSCYWCSESAPSPSNVRNVKQKNQVVLLYISSQ